MQIGSPRGAMASSRTSEPGRQPISSNFNDNALSVKDFIIPVSPLRSCDTVFSCIYSYLDSFYLNHKLSTIRPEFKYFKLEYAAFLLPITQNHDRFIISLGLYVVFLQFETGNLLSGF
jgi:hypothetical protein